ncbi:putative benzoate 4-monooxygenase cytochrome P450 protein [Rosellinia necatrix]|uniref:Putative benzoate 4-monooxygenase cytochrome P450 protein n=1 Tax=Rosellinia necatrix TaxID=77044 RepID=A0A1S8A670_ROSNE|nr:putative benzoate 4-monooxygenase cytochrome P450 protein [Rosellinia necatrix]
MLDIYNNERVTKSYVYGLTVASGKPNIFNAIDRQKHREKRRLIGQAINDKAMRSFEPTMLEQIDVFIERIQQASLSTSGVEDLQPVNITDLTKRLGADIVGHLAFGYALNMQTEPTYRFILQGLAVGSYRNNSFMQFPMLKMLGLHNFVTILDGYASRMKYKAMLQNMITSRLSQDKHAKNDLYSFVVDHLDIDGSKNGIMTTELWSEALFFFPAGGDTTTTTISALFFYLAHYRDVYDKLAAEIRQTFKSEVDIKGGSQLSSCRYLRACIDEALRISPPVSGTLWRELYSDELKKGPFLVDGHVIPLGTQVGVSIYALHHNEQYFDDPFVFHPDRWLTENREALNRMTAAFSPFSLGTRGCAGKSMAYLEASLVIAKTLWRFDFALASGKLGQVGMMTGHRGGRDPAVEFQLYDTFGSRHDGPRLVFHARGL